MTDNYFYINFIDIKIIYNNKLYYIQNKINKKIIF